MANEKQKEHLNKGTLYLINKLQEAINVPIFQDMASESDMDEIEASNGAYFVFTTGGFQIPESEKAFYIFQDIEVFFTSVNRENLDFDMIDVIKSVTKPNQTGLFTFRGSDKYTEQVGETEAYVDTVQFTFRRVIKLGDC